MHKLYIVGAGPGSKDLLTIKAKKILSVAEIIIYDSLVNTEILEYANINCKKICVNKSFDKKEVSQEDILNIMISFYKKGNLVVRLKNGDPMIFSRTKEEINILNKRKINFLIIPGISSFLAASSILKMPLTIRNKIRNINITTCYNKKDIMNLYINANYSYIFYMSSSNSNFIAKRFIENGFKKKTTAILAESLSTKNESFKFFNLYDLSKFDSKNYRIKLKQPVLLLIGEAFKK